MSIATNLKKEMICRDINQAQLAERSGVSKASISKYLEGKYKPSDEILAKLKEMDEETPDLGIRAFAWNVEKYY